MAVDNKGNFTVTVSLEEGVNFIEIIASGAEWDEKPLLFTVFCE